MLQAAFITWAIVWGLLSLPGPAMAHVNRIDTIRSDAPQLAAYGSAAVGVTTRTVTNPGQLDIASFKAGAPMPVYDRALTLEVWYPALLAAGQAGAGSYRAITRDGKTEVTLHGRLFRPQASGAAAAARCLVQSARPGPPRRRPAPASSPRRRPAQRG